MSDSDPGWKFNPESETSAAALPHTHATAGYCISAFSALFTQASVPFDGQIHARILTGRNLALIHSRYIPKMHLCRFSGDMLDADLQI
jgi:hypothetical protein